MLYAGIKESQHGIEIKMNDQVAALIKAGQHIGMFKDRVELGNDPENPLTDPKAASTQLSLLAKLKKAKAKRRKAMREQHNYKNRATSLFAHETEVLLHQRHSYKQRLLANRY